MVGEEIDWEVEGLTRYLEAVDEGQLQHVNAWSKLVSVIRSYCW